jgi:AIPR protein
LYLHNSITIVCDDFTERDRRATLTNPSVINGAQTLYAIDRSRIENSPALMGTRVIVRGVDADEPSEDDEWLQRIIRGVNTQNRVHNYDFRSNEPEQVLLQTKFRDVKVFYERKRGEWGEYRTDPKYKGFKRLPLPRLGQILMVTSQDNGDGVLTAKRGVEAIFDDRYYSDIFPPRPKVAHRFGKMYKAYCL